MPDEEIKKTETPPEETSQNNSEVEQTQEEVVEAKPEPVVAASAPEPVTAPVTTEPAQNTAGILVLQWLTYAFWGWLILALIWLMAAILASFILNESVTDNIPYAIAASVVLLPLAFITDHFYRKHEPLKKIGGAAVIMIIHAVLFAILGIITLITTVFASINLALETGSSDSDSALVGIISTGFATLLYAAAFLRTLNPFKSTKPLRIYTIAMLSLTVLLLILAIVGPLAKGFATRNDRLIEENLSSVENSISSYVEENKKLPDSLDDVTLSSDEAKQLVEDNLVEYKKETSVIKTTENTTTTQHRYQLCVEYSAAKGESGSLSSYRINDEKYSSYASTSTHDAGEKCYKLYTLTYDYKDDIRLKNDF